MQAVTGILRLFNYAMAVAVLVYGLSSYVQSRDPIPLLIVVGLATVGPIEDLLMRLRIPGADPQEYKRLVDQGTSLVLLVALLAVLFLARS